MKKKEKYFLRACAVLATLIVAIILRADYLKYRELPAAYDFEVLKAKSHAYVPPDPKITLLPPAEIPPGLPADLPIEQQAHVLQNFMGVDPATGQNQSTRVYLSQFSLQQNFDVYQKYLNGHGWNVVSSIDQPDGKYLDARKDGDRLTVTIAKDPSGQTSVNVSYVH